MVRKREIKPNGERPGWLDVHPEAKRGVWGVLMLGVALLFVLAFLGKAGRAGAFIGGASEDLFGWGAFALPAVIGVAGVMFFASSGTRRLTLRVLVSGVLLFVSIEALLGLPYRDLGLGGRAGSVLILPSEYLFGYWASYLLWLVLLAAALFIFLNRLPFRSSRRSEEPETPVNPDNAETKPGSGATLGEGLRRVLKPRFLLTKLKGASGESAAPAAPEAAPVKKVASRAPDAYTPPPFDLLEGGTSEPTPGDIDAHVEMVKRTLENFGMQVEMGEVHVGPTVTQYTLKPAEGVKLSRIVALQNDLALALAAHPLRIEAPIPGRSLVGIEVPNKVVALVRLRGLLEEADTRRAVQPLTVALGRDVTGSVFVDTLSRMPHLLIAGSTGSGKSIAIHSLLTNLIYRHGPDELQFLLVDPKRVELMPYNGIPHLLAPVIVEPQRTVGALKWAIGEMERRYARFADEGCRDIVSFHGRGETLPYVIIVIDELADIMAAFGREVEAAVVRLAQMARAVGIHLVVSTQRPSIEVITGLIKANITSRVAFQVASQIDSRTILDMAGAEKLLGRGDMLFLAGDGSKPKRLQGAFVSERDVKRVTDWLKRSTPPAGRAPSVAGPAAEELRVELTSSPSSGSRAAGRSLDEFLGEPDPKRAFGETTVDADVDEPLYEEAKRVVVEARRASSSLLQRRLRVGYARAARLIDILEERGVVGPGDGAKAREVLVGKEKGDWLIEN